MQTPIHFGPFALNLETEELRKVNGLWMAQIARNLTDVIDGFFTGKRYLIHDRDPVTFKIRTHESRLHVVRALQ